MSGTKVEWNQFGVCKIRWGTVARVAWFGTRKEAFDAAGLDES